MAKVNDLLTSRFKKASKKLSKMTDLAEKKQLPFRYVLADSVYTNSSEFIETVESIVGVTYLLQAPEDTPCWLKQPVTIEKTYTYRGQERTKRILAGNAKNPITFKTLAKSINNFFWYRRKVSEGTKGPIEYEFTKRRVVLSFHGLRIDIFVTIE